MVVIGEHGGDVVRFAGDAILAAWYATAENSVADLTARAVRCALALRAELDGYQTREGLPLALKTGLGGGGIRRSAHRRRERWLGFSHFRPGFRAGIYVAGEVGRGRCRGVVAGMVAHPRTVRRLPASHGIGADRKGADRGRAGRTSLARNHRRHGAGASGLRARHGDCEAVGRPGRLVGGAARRQHAFHQSARVELRHAAGSCPADHARPANRASPL